MHYFPLGKSLFFSNWSEQCSWSGEEPYIWRGENNIWNSIESGGAVSFTGGAGWKSLNSQKVLQIHTNFSHLPFRPFEQRHHGTWICSDMWKQLCRVGLNFIACHFHILLLYFARVEIKEIIWKSTMRPRAYLNSSLIILNSGVNFENWGRNLFHRYSILWADPHSVFEYLNRATYITLPPLIQQWMGPYLNIPNNQFQSHPTLQTRCKEDIY